MDLKTFLARHPTRQGWQGAVYDGLSSSDEARLQDMGCAVYRGKVREMVSKGDTSYMIHSDRLTAFDRLIDQIPYKGVLLATISAYWLETLKDVCTNHFLDKPHSRIIRCRSAQPIRVEVVVRGYLAGAMQRSYGEGKRLFCGEVLPEGLAPFSKLPRPFLTPTTKAAAFEHDEETSPGEIVARGICSKEEWDEIAERATALFRAGQEIYSRCGWILVDTKYEFGKTEGGQIMLIDEVHTPDSSRLWVKDTYEARLEEALPPEMFDKEIVRRALLRQGFQGHGPVPPVSEELLVELLRSYAEIAEHLTGRPLQLSEDGAAGTWLASRLASL